jgi:anti-anti-sigma factor
LLAALISAWFSRSPFALLPGTQGRRVEGQGAVPSSPLPGPSYAPRRRRPESPSQLEVSASETACGVVIRLKGVAAVNESEALLADLLALTSCRASLVTLDLSDLRFISSLAMGVLVTYRRGVVRRGGCVVLAEDLQPAVREALERAEVMSLFTVPHNSDKAEA